MAEHEKPYANRLVELSQEEVDEKFLSGPFFTEEEVSTHLGTTSWTLTKRFLLIQGEDGKEQVIDDYKRSLVNAAFASRSYLELQDVDVLAALVTLVMQLKSHGPDVKLAPQDGTVLQGQLSQAVRNGGCFIGRCFDLSKAYKQIAVSAESLKHAVLGARDAQGKWHMYTSQSLPFGAISSVYAFNKSAKALQHLLLEDFAIVATNYFDDFPTLEIGGSGGITTGIVSNFQLLGWKHAVEGKKAKPFAHTFAALGVEYNLQRLHEGSFTIGNKQERLERLSRMISKVQSEGVVNLSTAASIHGLLNFASGFTLGKALHMSAHGFSQIAAGHSLSRLALRDLCEHSLIILRSLTPREITLPVERRPIVVYTDGAFERTKDTWRAILIDPITGTRLCFAGVVPAFLLDAWKDLVGQQLISQIEFYAVVCLRWRTRHLIHLRRVLLFLDNEACRFALIKGRSASDPMFRMAHSCACMEASMPAFTWLPHTATPQTCHQGNNGRRPVTNGTCNLRET